MAASEFENPRRDERYGYRPEPTSRDSPEHGFDEPASSAPSSSAPSPSQAWHPEGRGHTPRASDRPDPTHRFDPDYHEWRAEQMRQLDKDYALWRQERYQKFAEEFETWRRQRFSGEHRPVPAARVGAVAPSYASAARSNTGAFRGPSFAQAAPASGNSPERHDKFERSEPLERGDRGSERSERPEKSGGLLSGLLGTGPSRK